MKKLLLLHALFFCVYISFSQTVIRLKKEGGVSIIPCKVNGIPLSFIFDTGASDVTISLTEAQFMFKNGYLTKDDIIGTSKYSNANGDISEGINVNLKEIEIQGLMLYNVKAAIVKNLDAPLLLGQSAISKLGKIEIDLATNSLIILNSEKNIDTAFSEKENLYTEDYYINSISSKVDNNDYNGIIYDCNKILQINPQSNYAYRLRGYAKKWLENYEDAIIDFTKAIEIDSSDAYAFCNRGNAKKLNVMQNKYGADRFFVSAKDTVMSKTEKNAYRSALLDFNKCISIDPKEDYFYSERASLYKLTKKYSLAIADYNSAINLDNSYSDYYIKRGSVKEKLANYTGAIADYNQAIYLDSSNYLAYFKRGNAKFELKNYQSSIIDYDKAIEFNPNETTLFSSRGSVKQQINDIDGAINDFNKAIELDSTNIYAAISMAYLKQKMKSEPWILVSTSIDNTMFYIKSEKISKEETVVKFWMKTKQKNKKINKYGKNLLYTNVTQLTLVACDCFSNQYKYYESILYNSKGEVIESTNEESEWKNLIPETIMESVFKKSCELYN